MNCPQCGAEHAEGQGRFCAVCGLPVVEAAPMTCPHCGAAYSPEQGRFCEACGMSVISQARPREAREARGQEDGELPRCHACGTRTAEPICPGCGGRMRSSED